MVAVLRVCNLHAGFPFWFLTIASARPLGTFRTLLEEIRHKVHLQRRGKERLRGDKKKEARQDCRSLKKLFVLQRLEYKQVRDTEEVRAELETVITHVWRGL